MTKKKIQILLPAAALLFLLMWSAPSIAQERKVSAIERRADRNFIRQKFDKAMVQYEKAIARETSDLNKASIHLKTARLYFMLRDYDNSSVHYAKALELRDDLFLVDDLCNYVDALRFLGDNKKAEGICLNNAYKDIYSRYQRFQNTLDALAMRHAIIEDPGFIAKRLPLNTSNSEFWVGNYGEKPFYAMSSSNFNDPGKLFFHRTHYYVLDETGEGDIESQKTPDYKGYFRHIPVDMQNGPLSFSPDMRMMVTTVLEYKKSTASVDVADRNARPFQAKLLYSTLNNDRGMFSKYKPIFLQESDYSYAHPYLFNEGKSLLFVSDILGGHGGFDIYVTHFDESTHEWSAPVNLGPQVNTEGDEICPVLFEDRLIFSSNGLPGFGGYDLFTTFFDKNGVVPRGVIHFPHPVNSVFNDYYMCPTDLYTAYFVSDRNPLTRDDIYYLRMLKELGPWQSEPFYGMSEEDAIMGGQLLLSGLTETAAPESVTLKQHAPKGLLLTIYFNFDSSELTPESVSRLMHFVNEMGTYQFDELTFDGYADEVGSDSYNYALSERRAKVVADFLRQNGVSTPFTTIGHGQIKLSQKEVNEEISGFPWTEGEIDWTRVNRRARRVEIYNK
ncbi:MAG: OmpA family protein [Mediterranea sp.]|jgi:outer membrane protein OmpA-like peptidoglycan-associated protein/tetratricopeptide (TPR) repeat protein|nr:OmpA family protein [Mediterranea sp.]